MNIDRTQLAKYNKKQIIYPEFSSTTTNKSTKTNQNLKLLFLADKFDGKQMIYALPTSARSKTLTDFPQLVNQGVSSRATFANQEK
jgi:hypothetical protein